MNEQTSPTFTTREAAVRLGISYTRLRRDVAAGVIPAPPTERRESGGGFARMWTEADIAAARVLIEARRQNRNGPPPSIWERREGVIQRTLERLAHLAREMAADPEVPARWREQLEELTQDLTFPHHPRN